MHDEVLDRHAAEGRAEIERLALVLHLAGAADHVRDALEHPLDHVHQVAVVRVGLVQLQHREFRVVPRRQPFVAEVAVDLVHAFEPADDEPLQVQLGRDAQVHVDVERVVVRDERLRDRAARNHLQHRRLDFHEVERVEEAAQVLHDARARAEHLAALVADDQVDVALAVALLDIGQAVPLVRQRPQRLDQQPQLLDLDRELAGARLEQRAFGADDVADVPALELVVGLAERGLLQEQLDRAAAIGNPGERRLAHDALRHHAAGHRHARRVRVEPFGRAVAVTRVQFVGRGVAPEVVRKRRPFLAQALELRLALGDQVVLVRTGSVTVEDFCSVSDICFPRWEGVRG